MERILPLDILSFWHNIDFRGEAAGGSLVTFHITSEIYAERSVCTNRGVGGGGWRWGVKGWVEQKQAFTVICYIFTQHNIDFSSVDDDLLGSSGFLRSEDHLDLVGLQHQI